MNQTFPKPKLLPFGLISIKRSIIDCCSDSDRTYLNSITSISFYLSFFHCSLYNVLQNTEAWKLAEFKTEVKKTTGRNRYLLSVWHVALSTFKERLLSKSSFGMQFVNSWFCQLLCCFRLCRSVFISMCACLKQCGSISHWIMFCWLDFKAELQSIV